MKKLTIFNLLAITMFFTANTSAMEYPGTVKSGKEEEEETKSLYPIPNVELIILNETENNYVLKADNKVVAKIKAGDKSTIELPMKIANIIETTPVIFFTSQQQQLKFVDIKKNIYPLEISIIKYPKKKKSFSILG